jgi:carboxyl-terminal processing protease
MLKKFITGLIGLIIFVSLAPGVLAHEYQDVPRGSTYYYPVDYLRRNDVFMDTDYFYPDTLISKAEFIKYLVILNSPDFTPSTTAKLPFEDTRDNAWYASYLKEAIDLGILDKRSPKAEPDKKLTVIDALKLLFHSQSIPIPNVFKGKIPYTDVARNTAAAPLIMKAISYDLIRPQRDDYVGIYKRVTRAEAARMIYKLDLVGFNGVPAESVAVDFNDINLEKIISVWELIESSYIKNSTIDKKLIADTVLSTLVKQLDDPYSEYMNQEQNQTFLDEIGGEVEGIGAVIGFNEKDELTVISPVKGAPAEKAGLKPGDVIVSVDGQEITGMDLIQVVKLIKGPKGTSVRIEVRRGDYLRSFDIVRDLVVVPAADYEVIEGDIMLVNLYQFGEKAPAEFEEAISMIGSDSRVRGMIIDLRDNPGGLLDAAVRILGHLVEPRDEIVSIEYVDFNQTIFNRGDGELAGFPIVVLVNGGSASASEIVAGTIKDYCLARIVGEKTFGKGTVQEINYFVDNSSVKLTVAKWLTPLEQDIQEDGVSPDVTVEDIESTDTDEQLERAVSELRKLMR